MNLKTIVKVGGITNLSDARYCAGMGVDMLGFCFSKNSEQYIEIGKFEEIVNWVSGVKIIAEFGEEMVETTKALINEYEFDGLLTSNIETASYWKSKGKMIIFEKTVNSSEDCTAFESMLSNYSNFDFVQIHCHDENLTLDIEKRLPDWSNHINILKGFNIDEHIIERQIEDDIFNGIALTGGKEEKPGMKDYDEIADILEVLELE